MSLRFEEDDCSPEWQCRTANMLFNFEGEKIIPVHLFISTLSPRSTCVSFLIQKVCYLHANNKPKSLKLHLCSICYTQSRQHHTEKVALHLAFGTIGSILQPLFYNLFLTAFDGFIYHECSNTSVCKQSSLRWKRWQRRHCTVRRQEVFKG